jgi:hypothetical protein
VAREAQVICAAVFYKVLINGIDYGSLATGQSRVIKKSSEIITVEIICTTVMMTNNRVKMKLKVGANPRIDFKVDYGGKIIPTVSGAEVLEKN